MIHPSAVIHESAKIDKTVSIGPFCTVGPLVSIGKETKLHSHVVIEGRTSIGEGNEIFPFCTLGMAPQDFSYQGEETKLEIGDRNVFRESMTVHRATTKENGITKIGHDNYFMAYVHIGHDVSIGNDCLLVNSCGLSGHVELEDKVRLSGVVSIAQYVRIGKGSYVLGGSHVDRDLPPHSIGSNAGHPRMRLKSANLIGLKQKKIERKSIQHFMRFIDDLKKSDLSLIDFIGQEKFKNIEFESPLIFEWIEFCKKTKVGVCLME